MQERLQKIISRAGAASRRRAEALINEGRVTINGKTATLGMSADAGADVIAIDGTALTFRQERTYVMLNKPQGYVTTLSDEKGRRDVSMLVRDTGVRLYPVGRLDMYSEGLLIMTDDGAIANALTHPSHVVEKTYHAWVTGEDLEVSLRNMGKSMDIDGYIIKPAKIEKLGTQQNTVKISITIHEGRNRQIRKMCMLCNLKLHRLMRVSEGDIFLGDLRSGAWRHLSEEELLYLQSLM